VVATADAAEREVDLARAAIRTCDLDSAVEHLSAAIRGFTEAGLRRQAAMASARLGDLFATGMRNLTAGRAWFARAARLVADEPPCVEQGWVAVAAMGCDVDDPDELLGRAEFALGRARQFSDLNLETKALADAGLAHVQAGRVSEGMALLDEAMAIACGTADDVDAAGRAACSFLTACYFTADFERVGSWDVLLRKRGVIGMSPGSPLFLSNHCDSVQATALCELGRWGEAEALLTRANEDFVATMGTGSWHPAIALADLRIRQGRLVDAEMLLLGKDAYIQTLLPAARLHLARGDHALARATALRGLRAIRDDRVRSVELLTVVVEAALGSGDLDAARAASAELDARIGDLDVPAIRAKAGVVRGRVLAATGDVPRAITAIEDAVDRLDGTAALWLRGSLILELARLREHAGDLPGAVADAKAATAILGALDVTLQPLDLAVLNRLGGDCTSANRHEVAQTAVLTRDERSWVAACGGTSARLGNTKGLSYLAELIAHACVERHALDLVDRLEGTATADLAIDRRRLGDAGEVIDSKARSAYRHRVEALRADIDDALSAGNDTAALQDELDHLVAQLAQAFGLGGRSRRASSAAERARLNVTRALRSATARVADALPEPGRTLDRRLRTGIYCVYEPAASDEIRWIVHH